MQVSGLIFPPRTIFRKGKHIRRPCKKTEQKCKARSRYLFFCVIPKSYSPVMRQFDSSMQIHSKVEREYMCEKQFYDSALFIERNKKHTHTHITYTKITSRGSNQNAVTLLAPIATQKKFSLLRERELNIQLENFCKINETYTKKLLLKLSFTSSVGAHENSNQ